MALMWEQQLTSCEERPTAVKIAAGTTVNQTRRDRSPRRTSATRPRMQAGTPNNSATATYSRPPVAESTRARVFPNRVL